MPSMPTTALVTRAVASWYRSMQRLRHFCSLPLSAPPGLVTHTLKHLSRTVWRTGRGWRGWCAATGGRERATRVCGTVRRSEAPEQQQRSASRGTGRVCPDGAAEQHGGAPGKTPAQIASEAWFGPGERGVWLVQGPGPQGLVAARCTRTSSITRASSLPPKLELPADAPLPPPIKLIGSALEGDFVKCRSGAEAGLQCQSTRPRFKSMSSMCVWGVVRAGVRGPAATVLSSALPRLARLRPALPPTEDALVEAGDAPANTQNSMCAAAKVRVA